MTIEAARAGRTGEMVAPGGPVKPVMPVRGMTCQACVRRVRMALESVPGVMGAQVELATGLAKVSLDPARATVPMLQGAVEAAGYVAGEPVGTEGGPAGQDTSRGATAAASKASLMRPVVFGFLASSALMAFYLGVVTLAQGFEHASELLLEDWYFVLPIVLGFGVQVGLFVYLRGASRHHKGTGSATAVAGVGTGTSSVSMVACCAHHLADLLPIIGVSGAALLLNDYRQPLMLLGIATNLVGIAIMVRMIRRMRRMQCAG